MHDRHNVAEHFGNMWLEYSKKEEGKGKYSRLGIFVTVRFTVLSLAWTIISSVINVFFLSVFKPSVKYGLALEMSTLILKISNLAEYEPVCLYLSAYAGGSVSPTHSATPRHLQGSAFVLTVGV